MPRPVVHARVKRGSNSGIGLPVGRIGTGRPEKSGSPGDVINYVFTITNTGNVTLTNVDLTDPGLTSISAISDVWTSA